MIARGQRCGRMVKRPTLIEVFGELFSSHSTICLAFVSFLFPSVALALPVISWVIALPS